MLEVYSQNVEVLADSSIPLNTVVLEKGCTAVRTGNASIALNKAGVYMVAVSASAVGAGELSIQLEKEGIPQAQAISSATGTAATTVPLGFTTLVQVRRDNSGCCFASPTVIDIRNIGVAATFDQIDVVVTKIC